MKTEYQTQTTGRRLTTMNQRGITILEVLLAGFLTALVAAAAFSFVGKVRNQAEAQTDYSEIQNLCRTSLADMKKTMRLAGYKLVGHPAFEVKGDTLAIYFSETQPVDTVLYFLQEFSDAQYRPVFDRPKGLVLYNLMRQRNSEVPAVFSDYITEMQIKMVDSANVFITMGALAANRDDDFNRNNGYRSYSQIERVHLRNKSL